MRIVSYKRFIFCLFQTQLWKATVRDSTGGGSHEAQKLDMFTGDRGFSEWITFFAFGHGEPACGDSAGYSRHLDKRAPVVDRQRDVRILDDNGPYQ